MLDANTILAIQQAIGQNGFGPARVFIVDENDQTNLYTLPNLDSGQVFTWLMDTLHKANSKEVLLATDCLTAPGQGTTLPETVVILHCKAQARFRVGVIEYDSSQMNPAQQRVKMLPVTWNNAWWMATMQEMGRVISGQLTE